MAVRRATEADHAALVDWLLSRPLSAMDEWVIAAIDQPEHLRPVCAEWDATTTLTFGAAFIDDKGRAIGGLRVPVDRKAIGGELGLIRFANAHEQIGGLVYPVELPPPCKVRAYEVTSAVVALTPPRGMLHRLSFGLWSDDPPPADLWNAWLSYVGATPTVVVCTEDDGGVLSSLGFQRLAKRQPTQRCELSFVSWVKD